MKAKIMRNTELNPKMAKFQIISAGYDDGPKFNSIEEARKELDIWKIQDVAACKRSFRMAKMRCHSRDSFTVTFGINLYSSHAIIPI